MPLVFKNGMIARNGSLAIGFIGLTVYIELHEEYLDDESDEMIINGIEVVLNGQRIILYNDGRTNPSINTTTYKKINDIVAFLRSPESAKLGIDTNPNAGTTGQERESEKKSNIRFYTTSLSQWRENYNKKKKKDKK